MTPSPSRHWQKVADLHPQLQPHVDIYPQDYRGERWYILRDASNGRHLRFNAAAYQFIGRLDGVRSVRQIWEQLAALETAPALEQDDIVLILTQLFSLHALKSGLPVDALDFFKRYQHERHLRYRRAAMNPLSIRLPLFDPDRLLTRLLPLLRPLFSRTAVLIWLLVVGLAALLTLANLNALQAAISPAILAPGNLLLMLLMYIFIKTLHEFAHAITVKYWGGEVHEMGITLLLLAPIPHVDASAAWGFRNKYKRALVGAAGILAEIFIAALALLVWLTVEPGLVQDMALNALIIGGVSTLVFNANPLLRFDGYHVLQDLLEIPNLYSRSSAYYLYLIKRYLMGIQEARSPITAQGEHPWLLFYGLAALIYRLILLVVIVLFLTDKYLFIGLALGLWAAGTQLLMPLIRGMRFLATHPQLTGKRYRASFVFTYGILGIAATLLLYPVSLTTSAEGVVWVPDQAQVFAGTDGFISEVLVEPGSPVAAGTLLIRLTAPDLETRIQVQKARYRALEIRWGADQLKQQVQSDITAEEMAQVKAELDWLQAQQDELLIYSQESGTFVVPDETRLQGRYVRKGEQIGFVINPEGLIVRAVVPQSSIGLVRRQVETTRVRLAERLDETLTVDILREVPAGITHLPSRALGTAGGGDIAVERDESGTTAAEEVFQFMLSLPPDLNIAGIGERVYIRFDHGPEPLAKQWSRHARQLLLGKLTT
jgi:putative peptide zinc metalloprotease protein